MWNSTMYDTTKLTVELRELIENGVHIWDFEYPSYYKGEEKLAFERKVTDHFYFRQIGSETVGRFIHQFRARVREIMPRYVEMYRTVEIMHNVDDPFGNVDIVETFEQETTGTASGSSSASGNASQTATNEETKENTEDKTHKFSNTPQGSISNLDKYMSEASQDDNNATESISSSGVGSSETSSESTSESESTGTVKHTLTRKGNQGVNTYAHDIIEFRQSIIDVDMMIINDLNCLFLGVY